MTNNLIISYDLYRTGQNYEAVAQAIKGLSGAWAKAHLSVWFVPTALSATIAAERIWAVMDANDSLLVVDATNNAAAWYNLSPQVADYLTSNWSLRRAA